MDWQASQKVAGGMLGHPAADLRDLEQLRLTGFVLAVGGHLLGQVGVAVRQADDGVGHHDLGAIEEGLLQIAGHRVVELAPASPPPPVLSAPRPLLTIMRQSTVVSP